MIRKFLRYYYTIKFLKWIQIKYQIWYRLRNFIRSIIQFRYAYSRDYPLYRVIQMEKGVHAVESYYGHNKFVFLNLEKCFDNFIIWDYSNFGKLWTYNLNYFEFLNQFNAKSFNEEYTVIFNDFIKRLPYLKNANEPFPTSLRIINWINYFIINKITNRDYIKSLYNQLYVLNDNKEFHLLGNHLLENGFALIFGGIFFQEKNFYLQGKSILVKELEEQILNDGAHFELTPMYHNLILVRLLDVINLFKNNVELIREIFGNQTHFLNFLESKAAKMCGWINAMKFDDGSIPHFNDSVGRVAPEPNELLEYAKKLEIKWGVSELGQSGYRRLKNDKIDLIIKTGKIGPDYIPGHAHADSLSFVCNVMGRPLLVDPAISTYERNKIRQNERSTSSHNTVGLTNINSSNVWGGFRVAKRAYSHLIYIDTNSLEAYHDGYWKKHIRKVIINNQDLIIQDRIEVKFANVYFHFHPSHLLVMKENTIYIGNELKMTFEGAKNLQLKPYSFALGFNKTIPGNKAIVSFDNCLTSRISIL